MKKRKLFTTFVALVLILGLGSCTQSNIEETEKEDEESLSFDSAEEALSLLEDYDADFSTWSGVNYTWLTEQYDSMLGEVYNEDIFLTNILASDIDGLVTGLKEVHSTSSIYGDTYFLNDEYEYYDGTRLYTLLEGELSSSTSDLSLSYFTDAPYYYAKNLISEFTDYLGLTSYYYQELGYEFEGSVNYLEDSNICVYVALNYEANVYDQDYGYGTSSESFTKTLEVIYKSDGALVSIDYEEYKESLNTGLEVESIYKESEIISNYNESVAAPSWINED